MKEPMTHEEVRAAMMPLVKIIKQTSFVDADKATDEAAIGLLVSKFFCWSGYKIGKSFVESLEDANFHKLANVVNQELDHEFRQVEIDE